MSVDQPPTKKICLGDERIASCSTNVQAQDKSKSQYEDLQTKLENCYSTNCLCALKSNKIHSYINQNFETLQFNPNLVFLSFITWSCQTFHDQLSSGMICSQIHATVLYILSKTDVKTWFSLLSHQDESIQFSAVQSLVSLLPLYHCGMESSSSFSSTLIQKLLDDIIGNSDSSNHTSELESITRGESAGLDDDMLDDFVPESSKPPTSTSDDNMKYKSCLVSVLSGLVTHSDRPADDGGATTQNCRKMELGEDALCQETQIKCMVFKLIEGVWTKFTKMLIRTLSSDIITSDKEVFLCEGFNLWQSLISVRANLSFAESRCLSADVAGCLPLLNDTIPGSVWRTVLSVVSECLCYGTTLGLQSIPPEEPCNLAHTFIRLVRFNNFLSSVPYKESVGMGGSCSSALTVNISDNSYPYDKGLVQKLVLIVLKCVALTTREARVESSSGESDSSSSSRESMSSITSGGSDMIIIERTMSGMYKVLDSWVKMILPVLPDQSLQESLLHILQEQDDVLIEALLCLLDTHVALYVPDKHGSDSALLDTNPALGFLHLVSIVSRDSSVLLDFLVSNETCFLLYFLRFLKFVTKDWTGFVKSCGSKYIETVGVLIELKHSIQRLMSKSLFPYNIGPVFRLLEKMEKLHLAL